MYTYTQVIRRMASTPVLERIRRIRRFAATEFALNSEMLKMPTEVRQRILSLIEVDTQIQTHEIDSIKGGEMRTQLHQIDVPDAFGAAYNAAFLRFNVMFHEMFRAAEKADVSI